MKVLVVEAEDVVLKATGVMLNKLGYEVGLAPDCDEAFRERVGGFFAEWAASIADCLERLKKSGYFRETLDSKAAAEAIVAMYEGAIMLTRSQRDANIFKRVGVIARSVLEQHKTKKQED